MLIPNLPMTEKDALIKRLRQQLAEKEAEIKNYKAENKELTGELKTSESKINALEKQKQQFCLMSRHIPGAVYQFKIDKKGKFSVPFMSKSAEKLFENDLDKITDSNYLFEDIHKEDFNHFLDSIEKSKQSLQAWNHQFRLVIKDTIKWLQGRSMPQQQEDGSIIWNGILLDITHQKKAEKELIDSKQRFKTFFEEDQTKKLIIDQQTGQIIKANKAAQQFYAYKDITKKKIQEINQHPEATVKAFMEKAARKIQNQFFFQHKIASGEIKEVEVFSTPMRIKNKDILFSLIYDITKKKKAEQELIRERYLLSTLMDKIPENIYFKNHKSEFIRINKNLAKLFRLKHPDEAIGKTDFDFFTSEHAQTAYNDEQKIIKTGKPIINIEEKETWPDGHITWVSTTKMPLKDKQDNIIGTFGISRDITERKRAQQALEESENRYHYMFSNINSGVAVYKPIKNGKDFIFENLNKAGERITRTKKENVIGYPLLTKFPNMDKTGLFKTLQEVYKTGKPKHIPPFYYKDRQREGWRENFIYKLPSGEVVAIFEDVSKRVQAQQAQQESEERLSIIIENIPLGVFAHNLDGEFVIVNQASSTFTGYTREELLNMTVADIDHGSLTRDDRTNIWLKLEKGGHMKLEAEHFRKDGSTYPVELNLTAIKFKDKPIILAVVQDITDRKKAQQALKESEEKFRTIFNNAPLGIFRSTKEGKFIEVNPALAEMLGYDNPEQVVDNIYDIAKQIYVKTNKRKGIVQNTLSTDEVTHFENVYKKRNGQHFTANLYLRAIKNKKGETLFLEGMVEDITERKQAEKALKESEAKLRQANATKDKFFSIIAHDLKSPFNAIIGFSDLLVNNIHKKNYEKIEKYGNIIAQESEQAMSLLSNLLEWSRTQRGKIDFEPEKFNLCELVEDVWDLLKSCAHKKNIKFSQKIAQNFVIYADKNMLHTILRNLISNAIKFSYENGKIELSALSKDKEIQIAVADNGTGMEKENAQKLFRIDSNVSKKGTNNEKGTGLGLILCKEFVEKHSGKINVQSKEGKGSTFTFTLPVIKKT